MVLWKLEIKLWSWKFQDSISYFVFGAGKTDYFYKSNNMVENIVGSHFKTFSVLLFKIDRKNWSMVYLGLLFLMQCHLSIHGVGTSLWIFKSFYDKAMV